MIILRTKHFGFYDQSGKLLEKYTKGNGLKRFQNWKEGILRQYKTRLKEGGLSTDLSEKEIENILKEQSRSRDAAVNTWANERKNLTSQIDKNSKRLNAIAKKLTESEKAGKISHAEAEAGKDFYGNELGGAINILENNRKNIGLGQLGLKREPKGRFAKYSKPGAHEAYDESKINDFLSERQQKAAAQKKQQQAIIDAQNANQNLQENLNNANKQISDLTNQNQFLHQQQGIHAKNFNNEVNKNKDLTNKYKDLDSRYNESVEEIKRLHEKYNKDVEGLINSHKNSMSVVEKEKKELEDSRNKWKYGAFAAGGLGLAGTTAAAIAARSKDE
jgi:hypothetical protein